MKIIHCADIHLDSPLNSNFDFEKAKLRKNEILLSFGRLIDFAKDNDVNVVIIAGDLFDSSVVSSKTERFIFDKISSAKDIDFLYLKGNHDAGIIFREKLPENFKPFCDGFLRFDYDNVSIGGIELNCDNYDLIDFESDKYNIAVMHGSTDNSSDNCYVNLNMLKNRNIDYLAFGHIHKGKNGRLDDRGVYYQCGCLEGRGFDECLEKGFVLIDTDEKKYEFIPFSSRIIYDIFVDISSENSHSGIVEKISVAVEDVSKESIIRITLIGKTDASVVKDASLIMPYFENEFFCFSLKDESAVNIDYNSYKNDISLKGEFVRLAEKADIDENLREKTVVSVLNALNSEDLGI